MSGGAPGTAGSAGAVRREGPLCREPWESFYILRRGVLPCCFGAAIAGMDDYAEAWNSPLLQEIRGYLARGELSPYCRNTPGCPIVQRVLAAEAPAPPVAPAATPAVAEGAPPKPRPRALRAINRILFGVPGRIYKLFKRI